MRPVVERLEELKTRLLSQELLDNRNLGNEIGFHIFDHDPADELIVREKIPILVKELKEANPEISIQVFDLYDIILDFFEKKQYLEKNFQIESRKDSEFLFQKMQQALRIATAQDWIVRSITEKWDKESVLFITGVGKAFPIIRSHVLLNNLQPLIEQRPLILFYPGSYSNGQLHLFKEFLDDHYYRAFRAVES